MVLALTPAAVIVIVTVPMAILYRIYFRHRTDLEYEEFRRARWLTAVPVGVRLCLFAGLAGFWIVASASIVGSGRANVMPEVRNGQYLQVDRAGQTTVITKAEYDHQIRRAEQLLLAALGFFATGTGISLLGMDTVDVEHQRRAAEHRAQVAQAVVPDPPRRPDNEAATRQRLAERDGQAGQHSPRR